MKLFLIAALAFVALANAGPIAEDEPKNGYIFMPDGDGYPHLVDLTETSYETPELIQRSINDISFNLYTKQNPSKAQVITLNSASSVTKSNFRANRPTRFVTHGWRSSGSSDACVLPRNAYLATGDYNVIVVDWKKTAGNLIYPTAAKNVAAVAARVSQFLNFMHKVAGLNFGTTMLVGHSLGAHVSGLAARGASGTIQAVVALDPARPNFDHVGDDKRVSKSDAAYVEVIHTNAGLLGLKEKLGHSDFFPNGGKAQPGCGLDLAGSCSHGRSYEYFAESIRNPTGFRAASNVYMGGRTLNTRIKGSYTFNTNSKSPYARG
ncbi:pancreatic triacylglycerol lipase [Athalia rosae]|uniref:pancreatic triacylglycerol lipase n=1 Tax=Athalia rosae TaxID=37344 RepID=UPI002033BBEE|nr:pancreatic triacylglycerol lipase [Athalia rosae]